MQQTLAAHSWDQQLGDTLFAPDNWHQSLSPPLPHLDQVREGMMEVGSQIEAAAFTVLLNRVRGTGAGAQANTVHWAFHATTKPAAFDALTAAIRSGLEQRGLEGMTGHNPHVTISYWAPSRLVNTKIRPIAWRIDELLLVESRGDPYRYHPLGRWPLRPVPQGVESQRELW